MLCYVSDNRESWGNLLRINRFFSFCFVLALSGCKLVILDPKGAIAAAEKSILLDAVALMLLVVVPVIVMSALFAWRYRAKNQRATYTPSWAQSHLLEAICWGIPCVIIIILAILTWISTHKLDPYRPLQHAKKPLVIQAVALNWKWLFIYPEQHIATVNLVQFPVDRPVEFLVTADAPMNSFAIPQLAGQIYAMSGMRTRLHLIANAVGDYRGL